MKPPERMTVMVNFRASPEQARRLRAVARAEKVPISTMIRAGLIQWLEARDDQADRRSMGV